MTEPAQILIAFSGPVECRRDGSGPVGLTLVGRSGIGRDSAGSERVILSLEGHAPGDLPATLDTVSVVYTAPRDYCIASGQRRWVVTAVRAHVHRDVSSAFYAALPPRRVPWFKRVLWSVALALAASPLGRRWLAR